MLNKNEVFLNKNVCVNQNDEVKYFEQGCLALFFDRPMEAMRFFSFLEKSENSAVFFNISLCFFLVNEYDPAYQYLEKALSKLPKNLNENSTQNLGLQKYEEENDSYKNPMLYFTPKEFPNLAREQIIRLMVDILFLLNKKEEMQNKISTLKNKNYKNVREKL